MWAVLCEIESKLMCVLLSPLSHKVVRNVHERLISAPPRRRRFHVYTPGLHAWISGMRCQSTYVRTVRASPQTDRQTDRPRDESPHPPHG